LTVWLPLPEIRGVTDIRDGGARNARAIDDEVDVVVAGFPLHP
jgi:hypothetical protein